MVRDEQRWVQDLSQAGPTQEAALADLRKVLERGLRASLANRLGNDASLLDDIVQEALLKILDKLHTFQGKSRFTTWSMSVAVRVAITELRRRHWKDVSLNEVSGDADYNPHEAVDSSLSPEQQTTQQEILQKMRELIQTQLTEKQKNVLVAELQGMPQEEIARRTGSNRNAIYKLMHDARKRLKKGLEAAGFAADSIHQAFRF
ncbi:MAG: RNA polymerase sigma factor [Gemmataceae bacterium]